jgi:hypothetical protein
MSSHSLSHLKCLSQVRRYIFNVFGEFPVRFDVHRPVFNCGGRRIFAQIVVAFQIVFWPDRAWAEAAAAIAADVLENFLYTLFAKSAFIRANHGFR